MTREEAIAILTETQVVYFAPNGKEKVQEALDMAIKSLQSNMSQERVNHESTNDLISRADVLSYPIRIDHYDKEHGNRHFLLGIESVMEYVESLPSADAVQVVRCKDCKHGQYDATHYFCAEYGHKVYEDDFCSYGERREL